MSRIRAHIYVSGLVQGVFFRANARRRALELGVAGWVRNLPDGRVELMVEGEEKAVQSMVAWCRRGPPGSRVEDVEVEVLPYRGEFTDFRIVY